MDYDMSPPNKRRRLLSPHKESQTSQSDHSSMERFGNWTHSVEPLDRKPAPSPVRTVPQRIEEIHPFYMVGLHLAGWTAMGLHRDYRRSQ